MEEFDCCAYIKRCAEQPFTKQPDLTVRQYILLVEHTHSCEKCLKLATETVEKYDTKKQIKGFSEN